MVKKLFINKHTPRVVAEIKRQRKLKETILSRPCTNISVITEQITSKYDMESMYSFMFGNNWRFEIDMNDINIFLEGKRRVIDQGFLDFLSTEEFFEEPIMEWIKGSGYSSVINPIIVIYKIWKYQKKKAIDKSFINILNDNICKKNFT